MIIEAPMVIEMTAIEATDIVELIISTIVFVENYRE